MAGSRTIQMPAVRREATVRADSFDEDDNTIEIVWTTGARVRRNSWWDGPYDEELEVTPGAVRLDRLNAGAPFLNTHASGDLANVLGSIVPGSALVDKGRGTARVKLSRATDVADAVLKIREGDVRNISVGYRVHKVVKTEGQDGDVPLHRVVDWEPLEISAVPIPADPGAQVRAGAETYPAIIEIKGARMPVKTNPVALTAADVEAERARNDMIVDLATRVGLVGLGNEHIAKGTSVDEFRGVLLQRLYEDENRAHPGGPGMQTAPAQVANNERDKKLAAAMESALLHRSDPEKFKLEAGGEAFMAMPLLEVARVALESIGGIRTSGLSKMAIAGEALKSRAGGLHSTSDFSIILGNVANKTLRAGYEAAPQTFRPLVAVTTVSDFKEVTRAQLGEAPQFEKVNEHGEFKRGTIGEAGEKYSIATYGKVVGITRQALINDDLGAFTRVPRAFGVQASQLESDVVWAQILGNPTMGDNVALFHNTHKNLGTAGVIGKTTISEARKKMGLQTGLDGKTVLNISPSYIIVSKTMQTDAESFLAPIQPVQQAEAIPAALKALTLIAEPRLDIGIPRYGIAGNVNAYYFASAAGTGVDLVELAYLEGAQGVYTETRTGFDVDGIEIKVRLDVGAKVLDWRGFFKNPYAG